MAKFKLNQDVIIKEVKKQYGRTESIVNELEEYKDKEIKGKVLSVDDGDNNLNIYVSFKDGINVWLNQDELELWVPKPIDIEREILSKFINPVIEEKIDIPNSVKAKLFDKLVTVEGHNTKLLYEDWVLEQAADVYMEFVVDMLEIEEKERKLTKQIIEFMLKEIILDFNISIEDVYKKLVEDDDDLIF